MAARASTPTEARMDSAIKNNLKVLHALNDDLLHMPGLSQTVGAALPDIEQKYKSSELVMAVMGEFSVGKSTLINALLGQPILATRVTPATGNLTFIRHGKRPGATVWLDDGKQRRIHLKQLEPWLTGEAKANRVEVRFNNPLLAEGLVIVDTPGSNVDNPEHRQKAREAIPQASVCLFAIDSKHLVSKSCAAYLDQVLAKSPRLIFVMTKIDELEEDELSEALDYARKEIASRIGDDNVEIIPVSAKRALDGQRELSNIDALVDALQTLLVESKNLIVMREVLTLQEDLMQTAADALRAEEQRCIEETNRLWAEQRSMANMRSEADNCAKDAVESLYEKSKDYCEEARLRAIASRRSHFSLLIWNAPDKANLRQNAKAVESGIRAMHTNVNQILASQLDDYSTAAATRIQTHLHHTRSKLEKMSRPERIRRRNTNRSVIVWAIWATVAGVAYRTGIFSNFLGDPTPDTHLGVAVLAVATASAITIRSLPKRVHIKLHSPPTRELQALPRPSVAQGQLAKLVGTSGSIKNVHLVLGPMAGFAMGGPLGAVAGFVIGSVLSGISHSLTKDLDLRDDKQLLSNKVDDIMDEYEPQTASHYQEAWRDFKGLLNAQLQADVDAFFRRSRRLMEDAACGLKGQREELRIHKWYVTDARYRLEKAMERTEEALNGECVE